MLQSLTRWQRGGSGSGGNRQVARRVNPAGLGGGVAQPGTQPRPGHSSVRGNSAASFAWKSQNGSALYGGYLWWATRNQRSVLKQLAAQARC